MFPNLCGTFLSEIIIMMSMIVIILKHYFILILKIAVIYLAFYFTLHSSQVKYFIII